MTERKQTVCDICDVAKKESNHWWRVGPFRDSILIGPCGANIDGIDVCGQQCASTALSRWMDHGSFEEKANEIRD